MVGQMCRPVLHKVYEVPVAPGHHDDVLARVLVRPVTRKHRVLHVASARMRQCNSFWILLSRRVRHARGRWCRNRENAVSVRCCGVDVRRERTARASDDVCALQMARKRPKAAGALAVVVQLLPLIGCQASLRSFCNDSFCVRCSWPRVAKHARASALYGYRVQACKHAVKHARTGARSSTHLE